MLIQKNFIIRILPAKFKEPKQNTPGFSPLFPSNPISFKKFGVETENSPNWRSGQPASFSTFSTQKPKATSIPHTNKKQSNGGPVSCAASSQTIQTPPATAKSARGTPKIRSSCGSFVPAPVQEAKGIEGG